MSPWGLLDALGVLHCIRTLLKAVGRGAVSCMALSGMPA